MLLGWHYSDYYSNAFASNQYLANHDLLYLQSITDSELAMVINFIEAIEPA